LEKLKRADAALARAESFLLIACLLGLLLLGVLQIILRYASQSLPWANEVMRNLTLWVGFLGASVAAFEGKHINVDALTRFLGRRTKEVIAIVVDLSAAAVTAMLSYSAIKVLASAIAGLQSGTPGAVLPSGVPVAIWQGLLPLTLGIMCLRFVLKAAQAAWELRTGGEVTEVESEGKDRKSSGGRA
jgi:TRAP-type C4-dicarboxylate transport system permease small subunit